jgi:hypothetical protein
MIKLSNFKLLSGLFMALFTFYKFNPYLLTLYCIIDLYQSKIDIIFHHCLIIFLNQIFLIANYFDSYKYLLEYKYIIPFLQNFEISTVFLLISNYIVDEQIKLFNYIIFMTSFFVYRIYDYYFLVNNIINSNLYIIKIPCISLFLLNLYWYIIILKMFFKKTIIDKNQYILQEYMIIYINFAYGWFIFWYNLSYSLINHIQLLGFYILNIFSNLFHFENLKLLNKYSNFIIQDNKYYFYDLLAIYIQSYILVYKNFSLKYKVLLFVFHLIIFFYYFKYNQKVKFIEINQSKYFKLNLIKKLPIILDLFLIIYLNQNNQFRYFLLIYLIILISLIKPFYNYNHLVIVCLSIFLHFILIQ